MIVSSANSYKLVRQIASTDFSEVFEAESPSGELVCVKKLKPHIPMAAEMAIKFRREAEILSGLQHPNIVRVYEVGSMDGSSYMALELVRGKSLRQLIDDGALSLQKSLTVAIQIVRGLNLLHSKSILHRDVKPDNVLVIEEDGRLTAKIVDFGLSFAGSDKTEFSGTLNYISPEQAGLVNWPVEFTADHYSFGALLFELLAGQVPFRNTNPAAVLSAHLSQMPESLVKLQPGLAPILDKLVQKLLAKRPGDRYSSGESLLSDLEKIESMILGSDAAPSFELDTKRRSEVKLGKVFVARTSEMSRLEQLLARTQSGQISILMVGGKAGVGKSALLKEFESFALTSGARFAYGKCFEFSRSLPCYCLGEALEDFLRKVEVFPKAYQEAVSVRIKEAAGELGAELVQIAPGYSRLLGEVPAAKYLGEDKDRQRFLDLMIRLFNAISHKSAPLVLLLDDLQWADQVVLDVLERISRHAQSLPVLVIGTYRSEEVSETHGLNRLIQVSRDQTSIEALELQPFDIAGVREWLSNSLGFKDEAIPQELSNFLFARSGGNIFFAQEIASVLIENRAIAVQDDRLSFDLAVAESSHLPENVTDLVLKRLGQLSLAERTVLGVGSIVGNKFSFRQMLACIDEAELASTAIEKALENCVSEHFLRRTTEGEYAFYHDKINEASRKILSAEDSIKFRRKIIDYIEQNLHDDESIFELTEQCIAIGDVARIIKYGRMAGESALLRHAKKEAARYFKASLEAIGGIGDGQHLQAVEIQQRLGESLILLGLFSEARALLNALKDIQNLSPILRSRILSKIAECLQKEGNYEESRKTLIEALDVLGQKLSRTYGALTSFRDLVRISIFRLVPRSLLQAVVSVDLAKAASEVYSRLWMVQLVHDMNPLLHVSYRFLAMGYVIGPGEQLALALRNLSLALANQTEPRISEALRYSREVVDVARQASANDALASGMVGLAAINTWRGQYKEALLYCERSREMFISVGNFWDLGNSLIFFYFCRKALGNFEEALAHALGLVELGERTGSNGLKASGHAKAAEVLFLMGKREESDSHIEMSLNLARLHKLSFDLFQALKVKGQIQLFNGSYAESRDSFQAAISILEEKGGSFFKAYISEAYLGWIESLIKTGAFQPEMKRIEAVLEACRKREKSLRELGHVLRIDGLLKLALGRFEEGQLLLESSIRKFLEDERPFDAAIAGFDLARTFLKRDPILCRKYLSESRSRFVGLKTPLQIEQCHQLSKDLGEKIDEPEIEKISGIDLVPALTKVSLAFTKSLDPMAQSRAILDTAISLLRAERAFIFMKNRKTGALEFQIGRDRSGLDVTEAQEYSKSLVNKVAATGKPLIIAGTNDGLIAGAHSVLVHNLLSIIASPIQVNGELRGLVYLDNRVKERLYTDSDVEILFAISGQIGIGFEVSELASNEIGRKALEKDLEIVGVVQNLLLPKSSSLKFGSIEAAVSFQPADLSGGDWWWSENIDGKLYFFMGDVTGHGAGSAMVTAVVAGAVQVLRSGLNETDGVSNLLSHIDKCLIQLCGEKYWMTFTAIVFDADKKKATVWYAGCPGILHLKSNGDCQPCVLPSLPLGAGFKVASEQIEIEAGDRLLVFTDGIFEQRMSDGREIGMRRIAKAFKEAGDQSAEKIRDMIRDRVNVHRGAEPLGDDHSFAVIRLKS